MGTEYLPRQRDTRKITIGQEIKRMVLGILRFFLLASDFVLGNPLIGLPDAYVYGIGVLFSIASTWASVRVYS